MTLYKNKYRTQTTRARWWDYGSNAAYFVTICTKNRQHYFGIVGPQNPVGPENVVVVGPQNVVALQPTPIGRIAHQYWLDIPNHFPFVRLDEFVVMPNHVHGIIVVEAQSAEAQNVVHPQANKFGPQSQNLASIIRGYKAGVKSYATKNNIEFAWQSLYHDHIIRNEGEFHRIATYIRNNPAKWKEDGFYTG